MTCEDCLAALATESLREIGPDSPVTQHCATCPECARLTTMLREREYETATVLNSLPPMSNPVTVAEAAIVTGRRRRVGEFAVMLTGAALVITIWIVMGGIVIPALNRADAGIAMTPHTETIQLRCLSPKQAGDIIQPYIRSNASAYFIPSSGISAITVRATTRELETARRLILEFEENPGAACRVPGLLGPPEVAAPPGTGSEKVTAVPKKQ